jgi:hypothetical protein
MDGAVEQSLAADGAIASDRAPQLKAVVRCLLEILYQSIL